MNFPLPRPVVPPFPNLPMGTDFRSLQEKTRILGETVRNFMRSVDEALTRNRALVNSITQGVGSAIASATTITLTFPIHHVTGVATIQTINTPPGFSGLAMLIPDGLWSLGTTGNIAKASSAVVNQLMTICFDNAAGLWYPSY